MSQEDLRTPPRGRSRSWAGPETSFQDDAVTLTSHASPSQEASYFHRSWSEGVEDADTTPGEMELDPAARDTPPPSPREAALLAEQRRLARLKADEEARRAAAEALLQEQFRKQQEYMRRKAEARNRRETSLTVI